MFYLGGIIGLIIGAIIGFGIGKFWKSRKIDQVVGAVKDNVNEAAKTIKDEVK